MKIFDYDKLRQSLNNMWETMSLLEIGRRSGISGPALHRIASGVTKSPTLETWMSLHQAFPRKIPNPFDCVANKNDLTNATTSARPKTNPKKER